MDIKLYEKIRLYRKNNGISQKWVAQSIGMSEKTLNGIELGRQRLTTDTFESICSVFNVDPSIFFASEVLDYKNKDE